jgi:uncharacterized alpha-E superfamily protein
MLSRIADSLFWINRYIERVDGLLRMLRVNFITSLDKTSSNDFDWRPVLEIFTPLEAKAMSGIANDSNAVLQYMITDSTNENSIKIILSRIRENARGVQDHLTKETWESINEFYHSVNALDLKQAIREDTQLFVMGDLIHRCTHIIGVIAVTMPRNQGWHFMNLGKYIERTVQTADILDTKFGYISHDLNNPADIPYWRNLLLSVAGYELYLKTYRTGVQTQNVMDLLVLNMQFPRSVLYSLSRLSDELATFKTEIPLERVAPLEKTLGRLKSRVEFSDISSISQVGLHEFLSDIRADTYRFSNALGQTFFAYS